MIAMAMMSSTIATASRNTRVPSLTRSPSSAISPTANAMSVAHAIAQPSAPSPPATIATKMTIGATTPPTAASAGSAAVRASCRRPSTTSRLISSPTTRKNRAISPSLTQWCRSSGPSSVCQKPS